MNPFSWLTGGSSWSNPASAAMPYLQKIPSTITPYYQPYIDTGLQAMNQYFEQVSKLATPGGASDIYNQLGAGYSTSPGAQNAINTSTQQANQVAASSGMFGTPSEQAAVAGKTQAISYDDFNKYMSQMMGLYDTGLQGEKGLTELGYKSSSELASDLAKNLMSEAGLEFAGTQSKNMYNAAKSQGFWNDLLSGTLSGAAIKYAFF